MRRQMQLRPSQGGKFRGPVGTPMPGENPAKAALSRLPWPLSWAESRRRKVPTGLIRQACSDGYIDPDLTFSQWNLTEKGADLLGVKPPGFREEFAEAGRAVMDVVQWSGPSTHDIGGWIPLPMGDAKPVRYDPEKAHALDRYGNVTPPKFSPVGHALHICTGRQEVRVCFDRPITVVAETIALSTLLLSTILEVRDRVRKAMSNGARNLPRGTKAVDDGFLISVVPEYYDPDFVRLIIDVRRI